MNRISALLGASLLFALTFVMSTSSIVSAHEQRDVGDEEQFHFVVGFLDEPAIQGELNAISVRITSNLAVEDDEADDSDDADDGEDGDDSDDAEPTPIEGLEETLTFEIIWEDQTAELPVETVFRDPGHYVGHVIPTEPGVYSFRVTGEIEGVAIEETFTAGPETFSEVGARAELEFPGGEE